MSRAGGEDGLRERLLADPGKTIEEELGVTLAEGHEIHVHEETYAATHIVLPPRDKFTAGPRHEVFQCVNGFLHRCIPFSRTLQSFPVRRSVA